MQMSSKHLHINWYILFSIFLGISITVILKVNKMGSNTNLDTLVFLPVTTFVPVLIYLFVDRPKIVSLGFVKLHRRYIVPIILISPGVWLIGQFCGDFVDKILSPYGIIVPEQVNLSGDFNNILLGFVGACVIAPIFEEILYRGVIMHEFRDFGAVGAIVSSAMIFAVMHFSPSISVFAFVYGLFAGYVVYVTGSIFAGMLLHALCNTFSCVTAIFQKDFEGGFLYLLVISVLILAFGLWQFRKGKHIDMGKPLKALGYLVLNFPFLIIMVMYIFNVSSTK